VHIELRTDKNKIQIEMFQKTLFFRGLGKYRIGKCIDLVVGLANIFLCLW